MSRGASWTLGRKPFNVGRLELGDRGARPLDRRDQQVGTARAALLEGPTYGREPDRRGRLDVIEPDD
jgi:hypothetical protein